jgi:hypothetical protein
MPPTITLSGLTTNGVVTDTQTIQPFGSVVVTDSIAGDLVDATISFNAADGTLSGAGLWAGYINNGTVTYTLSAATPSALQAALRGLTFTPTAHLSATAAFDLTVSDVTALSPLTTPTLVRKLTSLDGVSFPQGVATDAAGNVFVANYGNHTVEEFDASGVLVRTLSSGVSEPTGVATDAAGDVFVSNYSGAVEEFDASGAHLRTLSSGVANPLSVATDAAGNVFVANSGNDTVEEFDASGALVRTLSNFNTPSGLATDAAGDVFVANTDNNSVEVFDASGAHLRTLTSNVSSPASVATDAAGDVFVANYGNNTVEEFKVSQLTSVSDATTQVAVEPTQTLGGHHGPYDTFDEIVLNGLSVSASPNASDPLTTVLSVSGRSASTASQAHR